MFTDAQKQTKSIVICDDELSYACHLQEYLDDHGSLSYPVIIYTDKTLLLERQSPDRTALVIIAESEYGEEIKEAGYENILILNESSRLLGSSCPNVSKYQAIDHILSAIEKALGDKGDDLQTIRHAGEMHWIGFYTPITRCLQTSMALTMGEILGEQHKVLYLNFENWPALLPMLAAAPQGSISELLYFNDCAKEKVAGHLARIVQREGKLDMIMPCQDFLQLQKVTLEQWLALFETIREISEYEYLLLDLSESVQGLLDILRHCERIYTVERKDPTGEERLKSYENVLRSQQVQELAARTVFMELPLFSALPVKVADFARGPLADYLRQELAGENGGKGQDRKIG